MVHTVRYLFLHKPETENLSWYRQNVKAIFRSGFGTGSVNLYAALGHQLGKVGEGAVHGALGIIRKTTGRQLPVFQVIREALTASTFSRTRLKSTIAPFQIFRLNTSHFPFVLPSMGSVGGHGYQDFVSLPDLHASKLSVDVKKDHFVTHITYKSFYLRHDIQKS
jgi:hypothetical protein